jgi:hypothetical protein
MRAYRSRSALRFVGLPFLSVLILSGCGSARASAGKPGVVPQPAPDHTATLSIVLPSLCAIQDELANHHIAAAGTKFSNETHDPLHVLLADLEMKDKAKAEQFARVKNNFESQALSFRITMGDDLPPLISATREALALIAPSLRQEPCV